jgi:hypothetical protein
MAQNAKLRDQTREHAQYLSALNRKLDQIVSRLAQHGETLAAIVSHLGEDVIVAKIDDMRTKRREAHEAELAKSVQFMVDNGLAVAAPEGAVITTNSYIVGDEIAPDGTKTRIQHEMQRLDKEGQARYLGKKVGEEVTAVGFPTKVVVRAIYTIDAVKVHEFAAKKKAEASAKAEVK